MQHCVIVVDPAVIQRAPTEAHVEVSPFPESVVVVVVVGDQYVDVQYAASFGFSTLQ